MGLAAAGAADGDGSTVPDPQLRACINTALKRDPVVNPPILLTELQNFSSTLNCSKFPGIISLDGLQHTRVSNLTLDEVTLDDLAPLGGMADIKTINISSHTSSTGVIDLGPMASAADTLTSLTINNSRDSGLRLTTNIIGVAAFTNLTTLAANNNGITDLPGLESLNVTKLFLPFNNLDERIIPRIPASATDTMNISYNRIDDFTGVKSASRLILDSQAVIGEDVLLKSADNDDLPIIAPQDVPVAPAPQTVWVINGYREIAPEVQIDAFLDRSQLKTKFEYLESELPAGYEVFSTFNWHLSGSSWQSNRPSTTAYPTVLVDVADRTVDLTAGSRTEQIRPEVTYSLESTETPVFTPTTFALTGGASLPAGMQFDEATGTISGTPTQEGTFTVTVSAADATGLSVNGTVTLHVERAVDHTVTFTANDGTDAAATQVANAPGTLAANTFTRPGYTFTGWNTAADGTGTSYADGADFDFVSDLTLHAVWVKDAVTPKPEPEPEPEPKPEPNTPTTGTKPTAGTKPVTGPALAATGAAEQSMLLAASVSAVLLGAVLAIITSRRRRQG